MSIPVITISREYGSGGRAIGEKLAKELGIPFYNKELILMAAKESGLSEEYIKKAEQQKSTSFLYGLYMGAQQLPMNDQIFLIQSKIIREIAEKGPCVIVGRCADYVLDGTENLVRLFVYAEIEERINKVREKGYFPEEDILKNIKRIDRERRDYYRYYTGKSWENLENYDLMINTTKLSYDDMVECVVDYLKMRGILANRGKYDRI